MATVGSSSCRSAACVLELRVRHVCLLESQCGGAHVLDSQRRQQLRPHRQDRPPIKGVLQHVYPLCPHAAAWRDPSPCTRPDQHAPFGQQPGLLPRRFVAPFCDPTRRRGRTSARIPYGPAVGCESPPPSPLRARHTAIDPMVLDPPTSSTHDFLPRSLTRPTSRGSHHEKSRGFVIRDFLMQFCYKYSTSIEV